MKTRRNKRSSLSSRKGEEENSETIPFDLIIEILTRLPIKSIARFRCISKLWGSTVCSPNFTKSFLTISSSRLKLLISFTCPLDGKTFFFSTPQLQSSSSTLTTDFLMSFPINRPFEICRPVCGLVCGLNQQTLKGNTVTVPLICNPSTGQSLTLPTVSNGVKPYLGYDPIDKQFKVLCITKINVSFHQVLTLGTGKKLSWRMIECGILHIPDSMEQSHGHYDNVCINGVLYYSALVMGGGEFYDIACFDIRSEKFKCIRRAQWEVTTILLNYKGKLATLQPNNGTFSGIQLRILEDAENHQWSIYTYDLPPSLKYIVENDMSCFVGTTSTGEIVLSPNYISDSFYLLYYNPERKSIKTIDIQGMKAFKHHKAFIFLDYVEDVKPIANV